MGVFDSKHFNSEVFGKYVETVPRVKQNAFLKAGILRPRPDLKALFNEQTGGNYASVPMTGLIGGAPDNYDGSTDITSDTIPTFLQGMIVVGRTHSWTEKDFTQDITGHDFTKNIAEQTTSYWDEVDEATILSTLKGIFGVTQDSFATKHTLDISADETNPKVGATTLNTAIQKACGANKGIFTLAIMHSEVATNLENLQILEYGKYNDANGVEHDIAMGTWNGRIVMIDDECPTEADSGKTKYTTYVLGQGAFDYIDCGAKVPSETYRDPKKNGGEDTLIQRQRKVYAPRGFSFVQPKTPIISPTDAQLETSSNWGVVKDTTESKYFNSKAIPFVRIVSLG